MTESEQCGIIIPCLNEALQVGRIVADSKQFIPLVIVVDDGSSDATAELAVQSGAVLLRHSAPRGKGAALATGLRWLHEHGIAWALAMDGDGQHAPKDIPKFLECAHRSQASLIIGNRMDDSANMPWLRRNVNRWMSRRISRLCGQDFPDTQCGFRLVNVGVWASLDVRASHFEIESEMLRAFLSAQEQVEFVPIQTLYKKERSKIHPVRDSWRWLRWWFKAHVQQRSQRVAHSESATARQVPPPALVPPVK